MNSVQKKRTEKGWSQTKLSMKSGVPQTTISAIEMGKVSPTIKSIKKLAVAFGCNMAELIDDSEAAQ